MELVKKAPKDYIIYSAIIAVGIILDQVTKALAVAYLKAIETFPLIEGVLHLTYAENTGMAFSLFSGRAWALGVVSVVCILLGWLVLRRYKLGTLSRTAAMLMLGGAVGNMIDRVLRGYVVDMFEVLFMEFAIFNVADAALTVGTVLMATSLLFRPKEWQDKSTNKGAGKRVKGLRPLRGPGPRRPWWGTGATPLLRPAGPRGFSPFTCTRLSLIREDQPKQLTQPQGSKPSLPITASPEGGTPPCTRSKR